MPLGKALQITGAAEAAQDHEDGNHQPLPLGVTHTAGLAAFRKGLKEGDQISTGSRLRQGTRAARQNHSQLGRATTLVPDFQSAARVRIGPLRFNFGKSGLNSISLDGSGASFNIPLAQAGKARTTVGLPGTGLSWSLQNSSEKVRPALAQNPAGQAEGLSNSRRFWSGQLDCFNQRSPGVEQELVHLN